MIPFPNRKYSIIYADPPWSYSDKNCNGNAAEHYPTLGIADICALPVADIAADDCILFMWATYPLMAEALDVIQAWGFEYRTIGFQWIKQNPSGSGYFFGLGRWTRGNTEPCLIAVKGKPRRISAGVGQLVFSPIRRHSQKPDEVRDLIVKLVGDQPRIELFAREVPPGWDVWGNEVVTGNTPEEYTVHQPMVVYEQTTLYKEEQQNEHESPDNIPTAHDAGGQRDQAI